MPQRTRSNDLPTQDALLYVAFSKGGTDHTAGPYEVFRHSDVILDVVTPGYHRIIANGGIVNNPCLKLVRTYNGQNTGFGSYNALSGSISYTLTGPLTRNRYGDPSSLFANVAASGDIDLRDRSRLLALSHIEKSAFSFGEDIGEIRKTLQLLKNPMKSLADMTTAIRRRAEAEGKFRKSSSRPRHSPKSQIQPGPTGKSISRSLADGWLTHRFAISPLIRSITNGLEALSLTVTQPSDDTRQTARGFAQGGESDLVSLGDPDATYSHAWDWKTEYHSNVLYTVDNPVRDIKWRLGLRVVDLPHTIWQLLPYSFMVDRVTDVSNSMLALRALSNPTLKILSASSRKKSWVNNSLQLTSESRDGWAIGATGEVITEQTFVYDRVPWAPSFRDASPGFNPGNLISDINHIADLAALILSATRR